MSEWNCDNKEGSTERDRRKKDIKMNVNERIYRTFLLLLFVGQVIDAAVTGTVTNIRPRNRSSGQSQHLDDSTVSTFGGADADQVRSDTVCQVSTKDLLAAAESAAKGVMHGICNPRNPLSPFLFQTLHFNITELSFGVKLNETCNHPAVVWCSTPEVITIETKAFSISG